MLRILTAGWRISWARPGLAMALGWLACVAVVPAAWAQTRPYIGYTYPAGGQRGTTFQIRLGGQGLDDVNQVLVNGTGVTARIVEYYRRLSPQEMQLLNEQMQALRRATSSVAVAKAPAMMMMSENQMMLADRPPPPKTAANGTNAAAIKYLSRIEQRVREYVATPACASISSLVMAEVTIASSAEPGAREIRLATPRGVSNPLVFHVGQLPEHSRKPMTTAILQTLGKEELALRKRPTNEIEMRINVPCTVNGQIASGEINRYRFAARQGQRLVISAQARQLIPFIADAVPGWFQPVLAVYDGKGRELLYADDFRFKPDPVIGFDVPVDGEYVFVMYDSIHRGREDFVYRATIGELPYVTSIFPLGGPPGSGTAPKIRGWNLQDAILTPPAKDTWPGMQTLTARKRGFFSNPVPFVLEALPESFDQDANHTPAAAQKIALPVVINGRVDKPGDCDVFEFTGKSNDTVVVEVQARRLESPLDSVVKLTDAAGKLLAINDDCEDLSAGANTHQADSYFRIRLPADGIYHVQLGDTARLGGVEYGYRLRISAPQPDIDLRAVPSSLALRTNATAPLTVYVQRKDGYAGPIKFELKNPPAGITAAPVTLTGTQTVARLTIKSGPQPTPGAVNLTIIGSARIGAKDVVREAVPAEDRMQAFLWRHLVPASELKCLVFDPGYLPPPKYATPFVPSLAAITNALAATNPVVVAKANVPTKTVAGTNKLAGTNVVAAAKPKFTKQQIAGRLRQLKLLFEEGLLTESFYGEKVAECEVMQ